MCGCRFYHYFISQKFRDKYCMLSSTNKSYKRLFGIVSFIGLTYFFIQYRINMTRKEALGRFTNLESGKNFTVDSVSFAPKIEYGDSNEAKSKAILLLNNYIKSDRLKFLKTKKKRE